MTDPTGLVGPNAVIQLAAALSDAYGPKVARAVFSEAGFSHLFDELPETMIDETVPAALMTQLWRNLTPAEAHAVAAEAGRRTADYVIANRIPRFARWLLKVAPPRLAAPLLLKAIHSNAWTFVGSGTCEGAFDAVPFDRNQKQSIGDARLYLACGGIREIVPAARLSSQPRTPSRLLPASRQALSVQDRAIRRPKIGAHRLTLAAASICSAPAPSAIWFLNYILSAVVGSTARGASLSWPTSAPEKEEESPGLSSRGRTVLRAAS